jgi:hypothetical protein
VETKPDFFHPTKRLSVETLCISLVLAEDPETGEQGYFEVVALTNHPTDEILKVTIEAEAESQEAETLDSTADSGDNDSEQLNTQTDDDPLSKTQTLTSDMQVTPEHPVYIEGKGWLNAENLSIGDRLRRADGGYARVLAIERIKLAEPEPVYNFTVKGPHTYFVLEVGVLVHNSKCAFDPDTNQWRATEKIDIDGVVYEPGDSMPYPPRAFGVDEEVEASVMAILPEGHVFIGRPRPIGASPLDNIVDAKQKWVDKWMIAKNHPDGRRTLIDVQKLLDYDTTTLKVRAYDNVTYVPREWRPGGGKRIDGKWQPGGGKWTEEGYTFGDQFIPLSKIRETDQNYGLNGRDVLSDIDAAIYANRTGSLPDNIYLDEFGEPFNAQYHGSVDERFFSISHGALYQGLRNPDVWKKLEAQGPDRIPNLLAEDVIVFGNLPKTGQVGFIEVISYGKAVEKYAKPWTWYPP